MLLGFQEVLVGRPALEHQVAHDEQRPAVTQGFEREVDRAIRASLPRGLGSHGAKPNLATCRSTSESACGLIACSMQAKSSRPRRSTRPALNREERRSCERRSGWDSPRTCCPRFHSATPGTWWRSRTATTSLGTVPPRCRHSPGPGLDGDPGGVVLVGLSPALRAPAHEPAGSASSMRERDPVRGAVLVVHHAPRRRQVPHERRCRTSCGSRRATRALQAAVVAPLIALAHRQPA